jgi:hypothetical protein
MECLIEQQASLIVRKGKIIAKRVAEYNNSLEYRVRQSLQPVLNQCRYISVKTVVVQ